MHPSTLNVAAAVAESLIINQPFVEGNKRTGVIVMIALVKEYNIQIHADTESLYQFTIAISAGDIKFDQLVEWLKLNTETL